MSGTALAAATTTVVALAITATGVAVHHVSANDGGVWATNDAPQGFRGSFGEFVTPIKQLGYTFATPGSVSEPSYRLDVLQEGSTVLAVDHGLGQLYPVNTVAGSVDAGGGVTVGASAQVALDSGVLAVLVPGAGGVPGKVWAEDVAGQTNPSLAGVNPATAKPVAQVPGGTTLAVDQAGDVWVGSDTNVTKVPLDPQGFGPSRSFGYGNGRPLASQTLTTVGTTPVVLDSVGGRVYFPLESTSSAVPWNRSEGASAQLQQAGAAAPTVLVATSGDLYALPIGGGASRVLASGPGADSVAAQPVQLDGCDYAAWSATGSGDGTLAESCRPGPLAVTALHGPPLRDPVFRVNAGDIILNDVADGTIWSVLGSSSPSVDPQDWLRVLAGTKSNNSNQDNPTKADPNEARRAPHLNNPTLYARAGRTSILHVLDHDTDPGGSILSITSVTAASSAGFSVQVTPDLQAVAIGLAPDATAPVDFQYGVVDGFGLTATGTVTVVPTTSEHPPTPPATPPPVLHVVSQGTVSLQVLSGWRDPDSDPLSLATASVGSGDGQVGWTSDGLITFKAPYEAADTPVTISYGVTDGRVPAPVIGQLHLVVLGQATTTAYPPTAVPDAVRIVVGRATPFSPLDNDVFGADPTDPAATLQVAGTVASIPGLTVGAPDAAGAVTLTASRPGPYSIFYEASYGSAVSPPTRILVQAVAPPSATQPPVTSPVAVLVHGQNPATSDVLASDYDPSGAVLTVTSVSPPAGYDATVEDGEYLRIQATTATPAPDEVLTYQVSDGVAPAVSGQVTVMWQPPGSAASPVVPATYATVRAGAAVDIPVLASASDPDGEPVALLAGGDPSPVSIAATDPGQDLAGGPGSASVSGSYVRYAAPAATAVQDQESVTVSFLVSAPQGGVTTGHAYVTVVPADAPHQTPQPPEIEARVTSGGTVVIPVPTTGVDPGGDDVTTVGVTTAPTLGRIVSWNADSITYEAYPSARQGGFAGGTDTFTYQVEGPTGLTASAQVQVGITPPGQPQPPVAVDHFVTARPGGRVSVPLLTGDVIEPGDQVTIESLAASNRSVPPGAAIVGSTLEATAPTGASAESITYGISDGLASPSTAQVIIEGEAGYVEAPVAIDHFPPAPAPTAASVTVDALTGDSDPGGAAGDLTLVGSPTAGVVVSPGGQLRIPVSAEPRAVPYVVKSSATGATAVGIVYVLGSSSAPRLMPGAHLDVPTNGNLAVDLDHYVTDPGHTLTLVSTSDVSASPAPSLTVQVQGSMAVALTGHGGYAGPGELTVEVLDAPSMATPGAESALLDIPVTVGHPQPIVACPATPVPVTEGGQTVDVHLASVCRVWTPDDEAPAAVPFTVEWHPAVGGVSLGWSPGQVGHVAALAAGAQAAPGTSGSIEVGIRGTSAPPASLGVDVQAAAPAELAPIDPPPVEAGHTLQVDVAQYVRSPLAKPDIVVAGAHLQGGAEATVHTAGSDVTITPSSNATGTFTVEVQVGDAGAGRTDRYVQGSITVVVLGRPSVPTGLQGVPANDSAQLTWTASQGNGAPNVTYLVSMGGQTRTTAGPSYDWTGLRNGQSYSFTVEAVNAVGPSGRSGSVSVVPKGLPGTPTGVIATGGDGRAVVSWQASAANGAPITGYTVSVSPALGGAAKRQATGTTLTWTGLDNSAGPYAFTVVAHNSDGPSPASSPSAQVHAHGQPTQPAAPTATPAVSPDGSSTEVTVRWPAIADCNDDQPCAGYILTELHNGTPDGSPLDTAGLTCPSGNGLCANFPDIANDGASYTYTLQAVNVEHDPPSPASAPSDAAVAIGAPASPMLSGESDGNGFATLTVAVPAAHGHSITEIDWTAAGNDGSTQHGVWSQPGAPGSSVQETVPGLTNGISYAITATAKNEGSVPSAPSNAVTANPFTTPSAPTLESVSADESNGVGQGIEFTWTAGTYQGRAIDHFEVCPGSASSSQHSCQSVAASPAPSSTQPNPAETYSGHYSDACASTDSVWIYAVDSTGTKSAQSSVKTSDTGPCQAPGAPGTPTGAPTQTSIQWSWTAGNAPGATSVSYSTSFGAQTSSTTATQGSLQCGTAYTATVAMTAHYADGATESSPSSGTGSTTTSACPPPPTTTTTASPTINASKGQSWNPSGCNDSDCYALQVTVSNFPRGSYAYECWNNKSNGPETEFYHGTVTVTSPNETFPYDTFCADSSPYVAYVTFDNVTSNKVQF